MVVPTYNERDCIEALVEAVFAAAVARGVALEMVIVDDNSPDGTGAIAEALTPRYPLRVIHRPAKLGLGSAVAAGCRLATSPIVGVMDADFSHPPALVPALYRAFVDAEADVVVASRYIPGGSSPGWPWRRRVLSRTACLLARGLSPIRDAVSGFFLIRADIARATPIKAAGFKICLELLVRSEAVRLVEVPYRFEDREVGVTKMSLREALGFLVQLRDLYWLRLTSRRGAARRYSRLAPIPSDRADGVGVRPAGV